MIFKIYRWVIENHQLVSVALKGFVFGILLVFLFVCWRPGQNQPDENNHPDEL